MDVVADILERYRSDRFALVAILQDVQSRLGYLPQEALARIAAGTGRTPADVYAVATFYRSFSLKPRGKHRCSVCVGTACHVKGSWIVAGELERRLAIKPGETTADGQVTLETVNCLGACALGPIVVVDGHYFPAMNTSKVKKVLTRTARGAGGGGGRDALGDGPAFPVTVSCPRCNRSLMDAETPLDGHPSIKLTMAFGEHHGWLRISSLYGRYTILSQEDVPLDQVVDFFCPHCHGQLVSSLTCTTCGAPMVPMIVRGGGIVQICARRGCLCHMLDLAGASQ